MRAILANPRYTGRQVWNRQRTDHDLIDAANTTLGHRDVTRWNTPADWVVSAQPTHPALVSEADFIAVQHLRTTRETAPGRIYLLAGLLCCGVCGRRTESHWARRPAYRCRHGHTSATRPMPGRTPNAYLREDQVLPHLSALLLRLTHHDPDGAEPMALRASAAPLSSADAVAYLRSEAISLTYDPAARYLTADTPRAERVTIG
ncbi:recombinase family protein [Streptomyces sp. NPDC059455]|uniref:recombinase family protein n=1 Tax=Streptomyces sp. NPDC059455 TaxID=3346837 RepID=UPI0036B46524